MQWRPLVVWLALAPFGAAVAAKREVVVRREVTLKRRHFKPLLVWGSDGKARLPASRDELVAYLMRQIEALLALRHAPLPKPIVEQISAQLAASNLYALNQEGAGLNQKSDVFWDDLKAKSKSFRSSSRGHSLQTNEARTERLLSERTRELEKLVDQLVTINAKILTEIDEMNRKWGPILVEHQKDKLSSPTPPIGAVAKEHPFQGESFSVKVVHPSNKLYRGKQLVGSHIKSSPTHELRDAQDPLVERAYHAKTLEGPQIPRSYVYLLFPKGGGAPRLLVVPGGDGTGSVVFHVEAQPDGTLVLYRNGERVADHDPKTGLTRRPGQKGSSAYYHYTKDGIETSGTLADGGSFAEWRRFADSNESPSAVHIGAAEGKAEWTFLVHRHAPMQVAWSNGVLDISPPRPEIDERNAGIVTHETELVPRTVSMGALIQALAPSAEPLETRFKLLARAQPYLVKVVQEGKSVGKVASKKNR